MATDPSIGESTDPWVAGSEPRRHDRIGHYKILEEIGEGGFAKVYLAEQTQPVRRRVALKILKPGMDSRQIIARFEAERQALALMDHPNVARVLDAGTTETGRPYFVMDHVPGESITAYCDRHRLTTHRRLELLMQTCAAVQHAHQKGIIHRDIKPSNVLVTLNDGQPMVKVIDFGVAKAIDRRLTEQTVFTEHGQLIGTPEYMSPEQAEMTGLNVDTRTDIYSLGVLMYELLVGALPFEPKELRQAVVDEIRRRIREEDPPRPSRRLSSRSDAEFSTVAMHHGTSRAAMARELRGDLDWITMQAMDKDRTRRYATASELAADIRRHLQHEPVLARPPSPAYRVKKFVRRNRSVVGGAVAVFIVLIVGIVATGLALEEAVGQRREAQRQALIAQAVNEFLNYDLLAAVAPAKQGRQVTVREVLDVASTNIEGKFGDEPLVAASIRLTLAQTYFRLGEYQAAVPHGEIALRLRRAELGGDDPATLDAMNSLAVLYKYQSRYDEAETLYRMALRTLRRVMGDEDPLTLSSMNNLAVLLRSRGELHEAEALHREALATRRRVLGDEDPLTLSSITNLALLLKDRYELEEAEHLAREAMEGCLRILDEGHPQTLQSMNNLGTVLVARGELNEAESLYRRTLKTGRSVFGDKHSRVATMLRNLAGLLRRWGDDEGAEPLLLEALEIRRQALGEDDDATLAVMIDLGSCRAGLEKFDEAEAMLRESYTRLMNLRGQAHQQTREAIVALADLYDAWGKADEAAAWRARLTPE